MALSTLIANRLRSVLTMLGIVIGVGSVITLVAVGQGSQEAVAEQIAGLGSNLLFVQPGSASTGGGPLQGGPGTARTLSTGDAEAIVEEIPNVVNAVSELEVPGQVSASGTNTFARVIGVSADYANVLNFELTEGEFFNSVDVDNSRPVAVLGGRIAQTLFADSDPVGQSIRYGLGRSAFLSLEVVGVLSSVGGSSQQSQDDSVYLPFTFAQRRISGQVGARNAFVVSKITVQLTGKDAVADAKQAITELLLARHVVSSPDFTLQSQDDIAQTANDVNRTMTMLLSVVASISLVVGGIGIMNIMMVSVTERTHEIGIRKAVGARDKDVLLQFLTESVVLTVMGGVLGILAGFAAAQFMNGRDIAGLGSDIRTIVSWQAAAAAFSVALGIGIFFGLYPSQRAARMNPIEALRYE